jgi:hypothetical protein
MLPRSGVDWIFYTIRAGDAMFDGQLTHLAARASKRTRDLPAHALRSSRSHDPRQALRDHTRLVPSWMCPAVTPMLRARTENGHAQTESSF